jgi:hypothetical protein
MSKGEKDIEEVKKNENIFFLPSPLMDHAIVILITGGTI